MYIYTYNKNKLKSFKNTEFFLLVSPLCIVHSDLQKNRVENQKLNPTRVHIVSHITNIFTIVLTSYFSSHIKRYYIHIIFLTGDTISRTSKTHFYIIYFIFSLRFFYLLFNQNPEYFTIIFFTTFSFFYIFYVTFTLMEKGQTVEEMTICANEIFKFV